MSTFLNLNISLPTHSIILLLISVSHLPQYHNLTKKNERRRMGRSIYRTGIVPGAQPPQERYELQALDSERWPQIEDPDPERFECVYERLWTFCHDGRIFYL